MPPAVRVWLVKVRRLFGKMEADFDAEVHEHVHLLTERYVHQGMTLDDAVRQAKRQFGSTARLKEERYEMHTFPWLEAIWRDCRYASRLLRKTPTFSAVVVLTLGLGIGANTAIFSLVSAVLLRPLPFPDADRLMLVWDDVSRQSRGRVSLTEPTPADYADWKAQSTSFTDIAATTPASYNLTGSGEPLKLDGVRTTANLFAVLGMKAIVGRPLLPADDLPGAGAVVVLNESLWRSAFGADPGVVGRSILLNNEPHAVVGVVPPDFPFPEKKVAVWVPARFTAQELAVRTSHVLDVVARLKPGIDPRAAQAEMTAIAQRLADQSPSNRGVGATITPLHAYLTRDARPAMTMLAGAVLLVLLIACVNVANLLLARAASRQKELALRKALGAASTRVARQLLTESALLAGTGAVLGVVLSTLTFKYLARLVPGSLPTGTEPALNMSVLIFSAVVTSIVVLAFGTGPAIVASRVPVGAALKSGTARGTTAPGSQCVRNILVVAEISLTIMLLVAAGLLLRSYTNVLAVPPGFQPSHLLIAETVLSPSKYASLSTRSSFYNDVLRRVRALPAVSGAGYVTYPPLMSKGGRSVFVIEGEPPLNPTEIVQHLALNRAITPGYFQTMGVSFVRGRDFDARDRDGAPLTVIVNDRFAATRWPNQDPVGRRIQLPFPDAPWFTVVGVVANMRQTGLDRPLEGQVYFPSDQVTANTASMWPQHLVIRTAGDPMSVATAVRHAVSEVDPNEPVSDMRSMDQVFADEVLDRNTQMTLVAAFALLALLMASVGLYGLLSYNVTSRIPEIGVRMALGASRTTVVIDIVRTALLLAVTGIVLGAAGAFGATRVLATSLFSVGRNDPTTFAATAAVVVAMTLVASWLPAQRAASVDPQIALRAE